MQDNDPITLAQAAELFGIGVATLRAEADRGRLTIYRIGRQDRTTVNDIRAMVERCRVKPKGRGFTLIQDDESGLSEMAAVSSARDALKATLIGLASSSDNISPANTSRSRARRR